MEPRGVEEEIVSEDSCLHLVGSHVSDPRSHEQCYKYHGKGAALWYRALVLVRLAEVRPNLVIDHQLLLESFVGIEDASRHACSPG